MNIFQVRAELLVYPAENLKHSTSESSLLRLEINPDTSVPGKRPWGIIRVFTFKCCFVLKDEKVEILSLLDHISDSTEGPKGPSDTPKPLALHLLAEGHAEVASILSPEERLSEDF